MTPEAQQEACEVRQRRGVDGRGLSAEAFLPSCLWRQLLCGGASRARGRAIMGGMRVYETSSVLFPCKCSACVTL